MSSVEFTEIKMSEGYVRCLGRAIDRTQQLIAPGNQAPGADQIHAVKSILYAAIERAWLESERLLGVQRMLRELLMLTTAQGDPMPEEREQALRLLDRLASLREHKEQGL